MGDIRVSRDLSEKRQRIPNPVGPCEHPIDVVDPLSGEIHAVRCGSRLARKCGSCSALAKKDYQKIIEAGFVEFDPSQYTFFFLTLTAPSFGRTHRVAQEGQPRTRCACGREHDPAREASLRGVAVNYREYDYDGCVAWNYRVGRLWDASRSALNAVFPDAEYAKVYEFQSRGAVHVHALIRLPKATHVVYRRDGRVTSGSAAVLEVMRSTKMRDGMCWGPQGDCKAIRETGSRDKVVNYLAKMLTYVTKDVAESRETTAWESIHHFHLLDIAARNMPCDKCETWSERCGAVAHRRWGARSSVLSKSRASERHSGWSSVRRMDLKRNRVEYARRCRRVEEAMRVFLRRSARPLDIGFEENDLLRL